MHRSNRAERSIQTFKNHAIATLCTTSKDFPLALWDRLLPQIELCLNHLHPYKPNPIISAYAGLHGRAHDFRANPIGPAGARILIHGPIPAVVDRGPCMELLVFILVLLSNTTDASQCGHHQQMQCASLTHSPGSSTIYSFRILLFMIYFLPLSMISPQPSKPTQALTLLFITFRQLSNIPTITQQLLDIAALYNPTSDPILPIDAVNDNSDVTE